MYIIFFLSYFSEVFIFIKMQDVNKQKSSMEVYLY